MPVLTHATIDIWSLLQNERKIVVMPNNSLSKPNIKSYEESLNEYRKGKITKEQFIRQIKEKEEFDKNTLGNPDKYPFDKLEK